MKIIKNFLSFKNSEKIYEYGPDSRPNPHSDKNEYKNANNDVKKAIDEIGISVGSPGTNLPMLKSAFNRLKNKDDFDSLNSFLQKNKQYDGVNSYYDSIESLLNGELDGGDYGPCSMIAAKLADIGVKMTWKIPTKGFKKLVPNTIKVPSQEKDSGTGTLLQGKKSGTSTPQATPNPPATPEAPQPNDDKYWQEQANKTLNKGSIIPKSKYIPKEKSESVKSIQIALSQIDNGKYKKMLGEPDGQYGKNTVETVKEFQKDNDIETPDGVFGPITSDILSVKLGEHIPPHGVQKRDNPLPTKAIQSTEPEKEETPTTT